LACRRLRHPPGGPVAMTHRSRSGHAPYARALRSWVPDQRKLLTATQRENP
jgi:hypothetical protein